SSGKRDALWRPPQCFWLWPHLRGEPLRPHVRSRTVRVELQNAWLAASSTIMERRPRCEEENERSVNARRRTGRRIKRKCAIVQYWHARPSREIWPGNRDAR